MNGLGLTIVFLVMAEALGFVVGIGAGRASPRHRKAPVTKPAWFVIVPSAGLAMITLGAPTGWLPLDLALKGLVGGGVIFLAEQVPTGVIFASSVIAVVGAMGSSVQPAAAVASGLLLVDVLTGNRQRWLTAASVAALVQVALRLQRPGIIGATAVIAALILGPIVLAGIWRLPSAQRRLVARVTGGAVAFVAVAGALGVGSALLARRSLQQGVSLLSSAATTDTTAAGVSLNARSNQLREAASSFSSADTSLNSWWARPASAVPILAQQVRALRTAASIGRSLSSTGATAFGGVAAADVHISGGQVPLAKLEALQPTLQASAHMLDGAARQVKAIRSPWLLSPIATRLNHENTRLVQAQGAVDKAVYALPLLPDLLGAHGPRRYFLAIQTPSESRATGGLIGSFGEVTADNGQIKLVKFGHLADLNTGGKPATRTLDAPADYVARYKVFSPQTDWSNVNLSPDFPTDADVIAGLYPQSGGAPIDGVISIDPAGLAAMLRVIGPVSVAGWPVPITADNAVQVLLYDQYATVSSDAAAPARLDFLTTLAQQTWSRMTSGFTGSPEQLLASFASAVAGKHLLLSATRPKEEALFRRMNTSDAVPPVSGDFVGVITQNAGGDKLDWFLHRSMDYSVRLNPATGDLNATLKVTLRNDAPSTGNSFYFATSGVNPPLPRGDSKLYLSIYTPWNLADASIDGSRVKLGSQLELGRHVYSTGVIVPATKSLTVTLDLTGKLAGGSGYRLDVLRQPTVNPDLVNTSLHLPWGWHFDSATTHAGTSHFQLDAGDRSIVVPLSRRPWWW